ncbi:hypothetical protein AMTRI_Chr09g12890 [Amborella trichopoda]
MEPSVLLLSDLVVLPVSAAFSAVPEVADKAAGGKKAIVITQASLLGGKLPLESATLEIVLSVTRTVEFHSNQLLEEIARVLKPGGTLYIQISFDFAGQLEESLTFQVRGALERKLLLAGFLEAKVQQMSSLEYAQSFTIRSQKPEWKIGTSFSLRKTPKSFPKVQFDDEFDLIDEDSLLTEEDLKKPQVPIVSDCEVGSARKACKNCTCGRAEAEEGEQKLGLTTDQLINPQSACGSCGLGDAFRCGSCPYKGLPPFKLGEKISLSGNFLVADI